MAGMLKGFLLPIVRGMWVATFGLRGFPQEVPQQEIRRISILTHKKNNMSNILLMVQKSGSPVDTTNIPLLTGIWYIPGGDRRISEASTVLRPIVNGNV